MKRGRDSPPQFFAPVTDRSTWIRAGLMFVLVCGLYGYGVDRRSLWCDEMISYQVAQQPTGEIIRLSLLYSKGYVDHPPLFYLPARFFYRLFPKPVSVRLPNVLFAGVAVALFYTVVLVWQSRDILPGGGKTALLFTGVFAFHPVIADLAQEGRGYLLLIAATVLSLLFITGVRRWNRQLTFLLALALLVGCYTSYFGLLFAGATFLWALVRLLIAHRPKTSVVPAGWLGVFLLAGLVPWLMTLLRLIQTEAVREGGKDIVDEGVGFAVRSAEYLGGWAVTGGVILFVCVLWAVLNGRDAWAQFYLIVMLFPFVGLVTMTGSRTLLPRYLAFLLPVVLPTFLRAVWEFIARAKFSGGRRMVTYIVLLGLFLCTLVTKTIGSVTKEKSDWKRAVAILVENSSGGAHLCVAGAFTRPLLELYMAEHAERFVWHAGLDNIRELGPVTAAGPEVFLVYSGDPLQPEVREYIRGLLPHHTVVPGTRVPIDIYSKQPLRRALSDGGG